MAGHDSFLPHLFLLSPSHPISLWKVSLLWSWYVNNSSVNYNICVHFNVIISYYFRILIIFYNYK
jgi:hypothetical protein